MEDAIDMAHGVDPFRVLMSRETLDTSRINVVRRFKKNEPDSRGSSPAMTQAMIQGFLHGVECVA
jgi:hypothetical protein